MSTSTSQSNVHRMPTMSSTRSIYRTLDVPGDGHFDGIDFLTVNGVRFVRASEYISVISGPLAGFVACLLVAATIIGAVIGAWLFHC